MHLSKKFAKKSILVKTPEYIKEIKQGNLTPEKKSIKIFRQYFLQKEEKSPNKFNFCEFLRYFCNGILYFILFPVFYPRAALFPFKILALIMDSAENTIVGNKT